MQGTKGDETREDPSTDMHSHSRNDLNRACIKGGSRMTGRASPYRVRCVRVEFNETGRERGRAIDAAQTTYVTRMD